MTTEPVKRVFRHKVRVPYAHVDQMGVLYYANHFVYFEMARSEMLREAGLPYGDLEQRGVFLPVVEARCEYRAPARFDELLDIETVCVRIKGSCLHISYKLMRNGTLLAAGHTVHACVSRDGKVIRPPPELKALFAD